MSNTEHTPLKPGPNILKTTATITRTTENTAIIEEMLGLYASNEPATVNIYGLPNGASTTNPLLQAAMEAVNASATLEGIGQPITKKLFQCIHC